MKDLVELGTITRERMAMRASRLSRGQLTTSLRRCGYSPATAAAASQVFSDVIEALRITGFPDPATLADPEDALRQIRNIAAKFT